MRYDEMVPTEKESVMAEGPRQALAGVVASCHHHRPSAATTTAAADRRSQRND